MLLPDAQRYATLNAEALRSEFLIESLFTAGQIDLHWCEADRAIIGSAVPAAQGLSLEAPPDMRAAFFCQRRELGILNIGESGSVTVDGKAFKLDNLDCLYVGMGCKDIRLSSQRPEAPSRYYLLSYPAHSSHPIALARKADAQAVQLGSASTCNSRTIYKYIHPDGIKSCQLVMGFTQLESGSVWNTMPPHLHDRRSEIYFYFDLAGDNKVFHFMGEPDGMRHIAVSNNEAVISPPWSIHMGAGTKSYAFIWAMAGENQDYTDMNVLDICQLK